MVTLLWIIAVILVIFGIVQLVQGQILLGLVLIVVGLLIGPGGVSIFAAQPAGALPLDHPGDANPSSMPGEAFTVQSSLIALLIGTAVPLLNGFLLRPTNPTWVKTLVASLVVAGAHAVSQVVQNEDGTTTFSQEWFLGLAVTWVTMIATYYGLWKPVLNPDAAFPTPVPVGDAVASVGGARNPA
jgi:hypothetical protein